MTLLIVSDSWGYGSEIADPKFHHPSSNKNKTIYKDGFSCSAKINDAYRIPRIWPTKTAQSLGIELINLSMAGKSNYNISLATIQHILSAAQKPKLVIIGWSQINRHDLFYNFGDAIVGETIFPHSPPTNRLILERYFKLFIGDIENRIFGITELVTQIFNLHAFLKSQNINHLFLNLFEDFRDYSNKRITLESHINELIAGTAAHNICGNYNVDPIMDPHNRLVAALNMWRSIPSEHFFLKNVPENTVKDKMIELVGVDNWNQGGHPSEASHEQWSIMLADYIRFNNLL